MAKNKSLEATHYELLFIVSNEYSEDELSVVREKIKKIVTDNDGTITHEEDWGKKALSYPIKHFNHGYYTLFEFDALREKVEKIDQLLKIDHEILRHLVTSAQKESTEEKEQKEKARIMRNEKEAKEKEEKEKEVKEAKTEKKKVDLKDLDNKLDKILETDDLI